MDPPPRPTRDSHSRGSDNVRVVIKAPEALMRPPPPPTKESHTQHSSGHRTPGGSPRTASLGSEGIARSQSVSFHTPSGSSNKRKHSEMSASYSSSSASNATAFTPATKEHIENLYGDKCWHCGVGFSLETAHVLGKSKKKVGFPWRPPSGYRNLETIQPLMSY